MGSGVNCISYKRLKSLNPKQTNFQAYQKIKSLAVPHGSTRCNFSSKTDLNVCLRADSPGRNYRTGWNYFKNMRLLQCSTIKGKSVAAYALE